MSARVYVSDKDLPSVRDWKIGESYVVMMTVKLVGISQGESVMEYPGMPNTVMTNAELEIESIDLPREKEIAEMTDAEFGEHRAKLMEKAARGVS